MSKLEDRIASAYVEWLRHSTHVGSRHRSTYQAPLYIPYLDSSRYSIEWTHPHSRCEAASSKSLRHKGKCKPVISEDEEKYEMESTRHIENQG